MLSHIKKMELLNNPAPEPQTIEFSAIKEVKIHCKKWYDETYGNSYFAAIVTIAHKSGTDKTINLPFQYGYDDHYKDVALNKIRATYAEFPEELGVFWKIRKYGIACTTIVDDECSKKELLEFVPAN